MLGERPEREVGITVSGPVLQALHFPLHILRLKGWWGGAHLENIALQRGPCTHMWPRILDQTPLLLPRENANPVLLPCPSISQPHRALS